VSKACCAGSRAAVAVGLWDASEHACRAVPWQRRSVSWRCSLPDRRAAWRGEVQQRGGLAVRCVRDSAGRARGRLCAPSDCGVAVPVARAGSALAGVEAMPGTPGSLSG